MSHTPIFWRLSLASSVPFFGLSAFRIVLAVLWLVVMCGRSLSCLTSSDLPLSAGWDGWLFGHTGACNVLCEYACVLCVSVCVGPGRPKDLHMNTLLAG